MTNAEIIRIQMGLNGITEESHTYAHWKSIGFQVRKGEKAAFKATIWKFVSKKAEEEQDENKMFMKTAAFFTRSQVDAMA